MIRAMKLLLLLCLLLPFVFPQISMAVQSLSVLPNTARTPSALYSIRVNAISSFTANYDLSLNFPTGFALTQATNCKIAINGVADTIFPICTFTASQIVFTNFSTGVLVTSMNVSFNTNTALYAGSFTVSLAYFQTGTNTQLGTNSALVTIAVASIICNIATTGTRVGQNPVNFTLYYTPSVEISANSILQITLPAWSTYSLTNFISGANAASICAGQCTVLVPTSTRLNDLLTYNNIPARAANLTASILLQQGRNPASTLPSTFSISILTSASNSYASCSGSFQVTEAGQFNGATFTPASLTVGNSGAISLLLNLANPVSSISFLRIRYPTDLGISYTYQTSNQQTTQKISASTPGQLLLNDLTNSTSVFSSLFMASFTVTNPPYGNFPLSVTFTTQNRVSSVFYLVDTITRTYTFTPQSIVTALISATDLFINAKNTYTLSFTNPTVLIVNSLIVVTLPSQVTTDGTTTCSNAQGTCAFLNNSALRVTLSSAVPSAATLTITINNVINPATTTTSSSFGITTYYYNTSTPSANLATNLTISAIADTLLSASVTPSSFVVAATTTYTITAQNRHSLPAGATFVITFPTASFPAPASPVPQLGSFSINNVAIPACTMTQISALSFRLTSCFPTTLSSATTFTARINNLISPRSTQPTQSLLLQTFHNNLLMESFPSGLAVTMTTPAQMIFSSATPATRTVNALTSYDFTFSLKQSYASGSRLLITIPSTVTLQSGFVCSSPTTGLSTSCTRSGSTLQVTITGTIPASLTISVSNFKNNWFVTSSSFSFRTTTASATLYFVQQSNASSTLLPSVLTASYTPSNQLAVLSPSVVNIRVATPFTASPPNPSLLLLLVTVPSELTLTSSSCSTTVTSTCNIISSRDLSIAGFTSLPSSLNISFTANAIFFTNTTTFDIRLLYDSSPIASSSSLTLSVYCQSPCKGCTTTPSQCTSCLPTPYTTRIYHFSLNSTCLSVCPPTYYATVNQSKCLPCDSAICSNCLNNPTTCSSCNNPFFLSGTTCLQICPNTYYGQSNQCRLCINNCFNCTNSTYCITCKAPYALNPDNSCKFTCPSDYTAVNGFCSLCAGNCLTCVGAVNYCQSCTDSLILYNGTCLTVCPIGFYVDGNRLCQPCISPCRFCTSALVCTSCLPNFYTFNVTQCLRICPGGYFLPSGTLQCQICSSTCQTCSDISTNCTSCTSSFFFYLNSCYNQCPQPTYPFQGTCTTCVQPCATCLSGAFSCSTCIANYSLLNSTCVKQCPNVGYLTTNTSCIACPSNCVVCVSSVKCTTCMANFFAYQGNCVNSCPPSSPIVVSQTCTPCSSQCSSCKDSPDNCLVCTLGYFFYSYTCVQTCPVGFYSDQLTQKCQDGLLSKINFFPILISYIVIIFLVVVIKICAKTTSVITVLASFSGCLQLIIWFYLLSLLNAEFLQTDINYAFPTAVAIIGIIAVVVFNILHFKLALPRLESDQFVRKWQDINMNHTFFVIVRWVSLFSHCKFFRIIYSKLFNSMHFSLAAKKHSSVFTASTLVTLGCLLLAQAPIIGASFYLAYSKRYKDQLFYTALQVLVVNIMSVLFSLFDIYKSQDYFQQTQFIQTMRYLQKVNNQSLNKLEEQYRKQEEGLLQGQKFVSTTGGKFIFTKADPYSMQELLFEQASDITQANKHKQQLDNLQANSASDIFSPKSKPRKHPHPKSIINIFQPIQEEQAQYYQVLKYDQQDFLTAVQLQKQAIEGNQSQEQGQLQQQRRQAFGTQNIQQIDDNRSLLQYRQRRQQWNNIISHRQNIAKQIFNTIDTRQLQKQLQKIQQSEQLQEIQAKKKKDRRKKEKRENTQNQFDARFTSQDRKAQENRLRQEGRKMLEKRRKNNQKKDKNNPNNINLNNNGNVNSDYPKNLNNFDNFNNNYNRMRDEYNFDITNEQQSDQKINDKYNFDIPKEQKQNRLKQQYSQNRLNQQKYYNKMKEEQRSNQFRLQIDKKRQKPAREYSNQQRPQIVDIFEQQLNQREIPRERRTMYPVEQGDIKLYMGDEDEYLRVRGRRRRGSRRRGKNQLEQIYLQRLAQRVQDPRRGPSSTSMGFKYDF